MICPRFSKFLLALLLGTRRARRNDKLEPLRGPPEYMTINEQLDAFRGRCPFQVYMRCDQKITVNF